MINKKLKSFSNDITRIMHVPTSHAFIAYQNLNSHQIQRKSMKSRTLNGKNAVKCSLSCLSIPLFFPLCFPQRCALYPQTRMARNSLRVLPFKGQKPNLFSAWQTTTVYVLFKQTFVYEVTKKRCTLKPKRFTFKTELGTLALKQKCPSVH